jgi:AraC family transcriptional regulator of arabinose operon
MQVSSPPPIRILRCDSATGQHGLVLRHRVRTPARSAAALSHHGRPWSADFTINLVMQGSGTYLDEHGRRYAITPGTVFMRLPDQSHSTLIDAVDYEESWLVMRAGVYVHLRGLGLVDTAHPVRRLADPGRADRQFAFLAGLAPMPIVHGPGVWVAILGRLAELLSQAEVADGQAEPAWLAEARQILAQDLHRDLQVADVARRLGLDEQRFRKAFAAATGVPPKAYRINARIDRARRELLTDAVASVARNVGGSDPKHFSRVFRAHIGLSPRQFQRLARARIP